MNYYKINQRYCKMAKDNHLYESSSPSYSIKKGYFKKFVLSIAILFLLFETGISLTCSSSVSSLNSIATQTSTFPSWASSTGYGVTAGYVSGDLYYLHFVQAASSNYAAVTR